MSGEAPGGGLPGGEAPGGVPSGEQIARIERGVRHRIRRRRAVTRGITGSAAAVLLLGGGIAFLPHVAATSGASSGSAAGSGGDTAASAAAVVEVRCHASAGKDSPSTARRVSGPLPAAALAACGGPAEFQSGESRMPTPARSTSGATTSGRAAPYAGASPGGAVVCLAADGVLHVYPVRIGAADDLCTRYGYAQD